MAPRVPAYHDADAVVLGQSQTCQEGAAHRQALWVERIFEERGLAISLNAAGASQRLFVLLAEASLGKSTLLANWVARWRTREGKPVDETVHARFVGVGERSNAVDSLLRSILEGLRRVGKLTSETPDNANVLRSKSTNAATFWPPRCARTCGSPRPRCNRSRGYIIARIW
jgi:hypothetical protein